MKPRLIISLIFSLWIGLGCISSSQIASGVQQGELFNRSSLWNEAFRNRDIDGLLSLYAIDAQMATAGGKWKTRENIVGNFLLHSLKTDLILNGKMSLYNFL